MLASGPRINPWGQEACERRVGIRRLPASDGQPAREEARVLAPNDAHVLAAIGHERRLGAHPDDALPILLLDCLIDRQHLHVG